VLNSLKFQITAALLLLLALFAAATGYTLIYVDHQRTHDAVVTLAGRLQLTAQYLSNQAMRYKAHAPPDYRSYHRDLELYYKDLLGHVETFDMISEAFMHQDFKPMVTGLADALHPKLGPAVLDAIAGLETLWTQYRRELFERLGSDRTMPRLEQGAEYILRHNHRLETASSRLTEAVKDWSARDLQQVRWVNHAVVLGGGSLIAAMLLWLYRRILGPLNRTLQGFRRVAQGDFGIQVQEQGSSEAIQLTRAFNHLSARLKVLFELIERLQSGSDLEQILGHLGRALPALLRLDWIGVLFLTADSRAIRLEAAYLNGEREGDGHPLYRLEDTPLDQVMGRGSTLHLPALTAASQAQPGFVLLRTLVAKGMRDAIFLPLTADGGSPMPGVLVLAAREQDSYQPEQLQLLGNIAHLVTHSFGHTVRLAEHARLAAIGGFASDIAHEIRSPLATVGMALEHFRKLKLPGSSAKRADLAAQETERMGRLLEEMLLYARPLQMRMEPLELDALWREFHELHQGLAERHGVRMELHGAARPLHAIADRDRLLQAWLNLTRNACEAAPPGSTVTWTLAERPEGTLELTVHNDGDPIPVEVLPRLTQPFFTTKSGGTGLGLAIVRRVVEAHGGELAIHSEAQAGTRISLCLPRAEG